MDNKEYKVELKYTGYAIYVIEAESLEAAKAEVTDMADEEFFEHVEDIGNEGYVVTGATELVPVHWPNPKD